MQINDIHAVMKNFLISARLLLQRKIRPELMTIVKCIGYLQLKLLPLFLVQTSTTLLKFKTASIANSLPDWRGVMYRIRCLGLYSLRSAKLYVAEFLLGTFSTAKTDMT